MDAPTATVLVPTRDRPDYLRVTLASIAPQIDETGAELIVVSDGPNPLTETIARAHGAGIVVLPTAGGANAARNAGVAIARSELVVFVDDDVEAPAGWLSAILDGARENPEVDVFGGPIVAVLEGGGPRSCGRHGAPITTLDEGRADRDVARVWSANMAVRTSALARVGPFDSRFALRGDEEDWLRRHTEAGGRVRYLAAAGLRHRRAPQDARLRPLGRAAYHQGRQARRYSRSTGPAPTLTQELRVLAGCLWHIVRRRCAIGVVLAAHALGRAVETVTPTPLGPAPGEPFLSGESGYVAGIRATTAARATDLVNDARQLPARARLHRAGRRAPARRVLVLALERTDVPNLLAEATAELRRSHHDLTIATGPATTGGKFENLNALLETHPPAGHDWLIVLDDDITLPAGFLDDFLFLAERFDLRLAQPAHRAYSHAAWSVTRRRPGSIARETAFVEIGPLTAFHHSTFETLLPFPPLKAGWGLDNHWAALARRHRWRIGVIDATPIEHALRPVAATYDRAHAVAEARDYLADRPYLRHDEAQRTLATHRRW